MKVYVVFAHPSSASFCRSTLEAFVQGLRDANHDYEVGDLYEMKFPPLLDDASASEHAVGAVLPAEVVAEQDKLRHADAVAFVFPLWWSDVPAILKGWFDRVWTRGFAYGPTRDTELRRLRLGKALVLCTSGDPVEKLESDGVLAALRAVLIGDRLTNVGFRRAELVVLGGLTVADSATRHELLHEAYQQGKVF